MAREKEFKTLDEQANIQIYDRKLICNNRENFKRDLITKNYFNFINGFEDLLLSNSETEKIYDRASYEDFKRLFTLDRKLSVHLFEEITKIETQIKTAISYYFCEKYCSNGVSSNLNYLCRLNYNGFDSSGASTKDISTFHKHEIFSNKNKTHAKIKNIKFTGSITESSNTRYPSDLVLSGKFEGIFKGLSRNLYQGSTSIARNRLPDFTLNDYNSINLPRDLDIFITLKYFSDLCKIKHPHISSYKNPPMWVVINTLSIKSLYYLYIGLDEDIKDSVIKSVSGTNFEKNGIKYKEAFLNLFDLLSFVRNSIFHGSLATLILSPSNFELNTYLKEKKSIPTKYGLKLYDIINLFSLFSDFNFQKIDHCINNYIAINKILFKNDINNNLIKRIKS